MTSGLQPILFLMVISLSSLLLNGQDTLVGWTFKQFGHSTAVNCDMGTVTNESSQLRNFDDKTLLYSEIFAEVNQSSIDNYAAMAEDWTGGAGFRYWIIDFYSKYYKSLTLYSEQFSSAGGPRNFKLQYRIGDELPAAWKDVDDGEVICGENWTAGILDHISLPPDCNSVEQKIYIRWLMISNESVNGDTVNHDGKSMIDNILIRGTKIAGIDDQDAGLLRVFPNPTHGKIQIGPGTGTRKIELFSANGQLIGEYFPEMRRPEIDVENLESGIYFIKVRLDDEQRGRVFKIIRN